MNLEEKENTAEAAPEAAAQVTIQAVQENNVQEAGVRETAGTAAPQEQPAKKPQNRRPARKKTVSKEQGGNGEAQKKKTRVPDRVRQRAGADKRERTRPELLPGSPRTAPAQGPPREPEAQRRPGIPGSPRRPEVQGRPGIPESPEIPESPRHPGIPGSPRTPEIPVNQRRFPHRPDRRRGMEKRTERAS